MKTYEVLEICGVIVVNLLSLVIVKTIYEIKSNKYDLETINPLIFLAGCWNATNWLVYSIIVNDMLLFFSSAPYIVISLYMCIVLFKSKYTKLYDYLLLTLFLCGISYTFVYTFLQFNKKVMSGVLGTTSTIVYSTIPLTRRQQIYLPISVASVVNYTIWVSFSIMIQDIYQCITNSIALLVSLVQLGIYLLDNVKCTASTSVNILPR